MSSLIDKEKVIELLIDEMENWHAIIDKVFLEGCIDEIRKMPPVDAEPVKHGKWNKRTTIAYCRNDIFIDYDEYLCSECQKVTEIKENYCSNCGAKMDLEGEQVETHQVGPCCVGGKKRE